MNTDKLKMAVIAVCCTMLAVSCNQQVETTKPELTTVGNPYLPMWEHIPDGEPLKTLTNQESKGFISTGLTTVE